MLKNLSETLLKGKGRTAINEITEDDDDDYDGILSLNLAEKDELISGLRHLYDSSDRTEQVRLLTIAPYNWGRQKVQRFFNTPERQARRSRQLLGSGGFLARPEDLRGKKPLDAATAQAVIHFFEQDSISRVSPKKSDVILVKKQPVAKRFMLLTIGEAVEKFKSDFSQYQIGRSQFYALRPRHVKPMSPHDTCCCVYEPFHVSHDRFVDTVLKAPSQNRLSVRYVIGARVSFNVAQAVSQNRVPVGFYGIFAESTIKYPFWKRPFCGLNISARVHSIELRFSGEKHFTEAYTSPKFEHQQCNRCFSISVQIGRKNAFFHQLWPSISRDWRMMETHNFAQRDTPIPTTDGIILSPPEWSIDTGRSDQTPIFLEKGTFEPRFSPKINPNFSPLLARLVAHTLVYNRVGS